MSTPAADGFVMPAEWAPHARCWMAWPVREETWGTAEAFEAAKRAYAEVAQAICAFEPVTMICRQADVPEASLACGKGVDVLPMPLDDSWTRDTGPSFLVHPDGRVAGVDWQFNAWGGNYPDCREDQLLARRLLEHVNLPRYEAPLVMEGGAFHVDGEGTLITTEQCLLNPNRNPGLTRSEIEEYLKAYLGIRTVVWLGEGYQDDETDGHVDELCLFARPGVVLALTTDDPADANFKAFQDNLDRLKKARDAHGRSFEVIELKQPAREDWRGRRLTLSYANMYIANGGVVMPAFGDPADRAAYQAVRKAFPDREVVQIPVLDIVRGGGGIHCITQQQPIP
ncbi:MAG TPA: agmatine deiminase family protein [Azospirillaceae bacterium]|nr:agmatine deiminase family protein [Azospirillaceae bacterium]